MIECHIPAQTRTPFPASRDFPSRGNERHGEKNRRVIYFMYHSGVSPFGGAVSHQRGESHRRWLITVMLIMSYDTERKSRNADFISIARRAIRNPRPKGPSNLRTLRPSGRSILRTFPSEPFEPCEPYEPSRRRRVHVHVQEHNFSPIAFPKRGIIKKHITKNFRYENRSGMPGQLQGEIFC